MIALRRFSFLPLVGYSQKIPAVLTQGTTWMLVFRWVVVGCQAVTLKITWSLWQVHETPPMLPLLPLPAFDMGVILLISLAVILIQPLPGIILHTVLVLYAMLIDQIRLQPEVISLIFMMWGTLPNPNAKALGRAHLVALWFYAGFNKLVSPRFLHGTAQWMLSALISQPPEWLRDNVGYIIALTELGIGVLAIFPPTRKLAGLVAFGLHIGILIDLGPYGHNWNESVWAWNVALSLAGFALIFPWKGWGLCPRCHVLVRVLAVLILLAPAGFYIGVTNAYLAHHLYSSAVPRASATAALNPSITWQFFEVPFPPEHRLFEQLFEETCSPGSRMTIRDSRWWFRKKGMEVVTLTCPSTP